MSKSKKSNTQKNTSKKTTAKAYQAPSLKKMQKLTKVTGSLKVTGGAAV
ncbi:MAG: hypothetical protein RLY14_959 [Planctomycetota bacterium]|jgi:hypothetical protein